jgi:metal-responsive CopG/Arc/MetJ family transcriptional regulator
MLKVIAISLPEGLCEKMDSKRGDIPRSRFISRLVEKAVGKEVHW